MNNRKSILCLFLLFLLSLGSLSVNAQTVSKVFKEQTLKTIDLHFIDIIHNSIRAKATKIIVNIEDNSSKNIFKFDNSI